MATPGAKKRAKELACVLDHRTGKKVTPTAEQMEAFGVLLEQARNGLPITEKEILKQMGLKPADGRRIFKAKGWNVLLSEIDDSMIINKLKEYALDASDKRVSMEAIKEILKLKDRYPAGKLKVTQYQDELENLG